jgi:hypothetical protein
MESSIKQEQTVNETNQVECSESTCENVEPKDMAHKDKLLSQEVKISNLSEISSNSEQSYTTLTSEKLDNTKTEIEQNKSEENYGKQKPFRYSYSYCYEKKIDKDGKVNKKFSAIKNEDDKWFTMNEEGKWYQTDKKEAEVLSQKPSNFKDIANINNNEKLYLEGYDADKEDSEDEEQKDFENEIKREMKRRRDWERKMQNHKRGKKTENGRKTSLGKDCRLRSPDDHLGYFSIVPHDLMTSFPLCTSFAPVLAPRYFRPPQWNGFW